MLEFKDVEFRYPGAQDPVLSNISFTASPGQTTAIVGSTGSGKSTLISLIPRLYDVTAGSIEIDGRDIREMNRADLWRHIGFVPQKAFLFSGTVASNLRFGDEAATDADLWHALSVAQGKEFVEDMPEGLDEPIAQGGTNVSGGQRQRLAIARALVKKADIYVFDDSFSAVDFKTDSMLRAALKRRHDQLDSHHRGAARQQHHACGPDHRARQRHHRRHRHSRGTPGELRDLSRDRVLAADGGGSGMSEQEKIPGSDAPQTPAAPDRAVGAATTKSVGPPGAGQGPGQRRSGPGFGPPGLVGSGEKAKNFKASFKRLRQKAATRVSQDQHSHLPSCRQCLSHSGGPEDTGPRHQPDL